MLRGGVFQLKVFSGLPKPPKGGLMNLKETDAKGIPILPSTFICIRIIPADLPPSPAPSYKAGYDKKILETESRLEKSFINIILINAI